MAFEEHGSMDAGYDRLAGSVRKMARRLKFKGSLPVVPYGDEPRTFIIALAFNKPEEAQARQKFANLETQIRELGNIEILEVIWKIHTQSKVNGIVTLKFREKAFQS
jgi:hypothetical protein